MSTIDNFYLEEYKSSQQILSSLVLNTPYKIDTLSTSPKLSKSFPLPIEISWDSASISKLLLKTMLSTLIIMISICCIVSCFLIPTEYENAKLYSTNQNLTNKQFILINKVHEVSSYRNLFTASEVLSFTEPEETLYLDSTPAYINHDNPVKPFQIEFSGF